MQRFGFFASSCSQIRTTRHFFRRSSRFTNRSRALLAESFFFQNARLLTGILECLGQPCQKQPSTNTATRKTGKTKSGLPKMDRLRRQPVTRCNRRMWSNANSVSLLPRPRMRDITSERFFLVKTSGIQAHQLSFVDDSGFRRLIRVEFIVSDCSSTAATKCFVR